MRPVDHTRKSKPSSLANAESESLARNAQARLQQPLSAKAIGSTLGVLARVAPVNGALAALPLLFLIPVVVVMGLLLLTAFVITVALLFQAKQNSTSLNLTLAGSLFALGFFAVAFSDFGRICLRVFGFWLKWHYHFLLGDQPANRSQP